MNLKKEYSNNLKTLSVFLIVALFVSILNVGCLSRFLFHLPCPFCGTSRAIISFLQLDFASAFYYHPLFFLFPVFVFFLIDYMNHNRGFKIVLLLTILYLLTFILRLLFFTIP